MICSHLVSDDSCSHPIILYCLLNLRVFLFRFLSFSSVFTDVSSSTFAFKCSHHFHSLFMISDHVSSRDAISHPVSLVMFRVFCRRLFLTCRFRIRVQRCVFHAFRSTLRLMIEFDLQLLVHLQCSASPCRRRSIM